MYPLVPTYYTEAVYVVNVTNSLFPHPIHTCYTVTVISRFLAIDWRLYLYLDFSTGPIWARGIVMRVNPIDGLNAAQKEAVLATDGPVMVLAGAGSGKTRVITHRILQLIQNGVAPHEILAVTFTNKAAKEMRERVLSLLEKHYGAERALIDSTPQVTTFHSFGVRILREQHERLGLRKQFTIYDRSDSVRAMKAALEEAGYDPKRFEPRRMLSMISRAKGDGKTHREYKDDADSYGKQVAGEVWEKYHAIMRKEHALDFDDLLLLTKELLATHPDIRDRYQKRFRYIHIDEYQDTNKIQYEIARMLAGETANVCVVGDIDQNIYSWRGANLDNILQFERHFPNARVILLEENYRSTQTIIAASNSIIEKNVKRVPKTVFTNNEEGEPISVYAAWNEADEAYHIAKESRALLKSGISAGEIAVLYRANFQSRVLEEAFMTEGIPYQMLGTRFFERKEVKDVLSYLRLALNPDSSGDLARIINTPARGIGKTTVLKLLEGKRDEIQKAGLARVVQFEDMMAEIRDASKFSKLSELLKLIVRRAGFEEELKKDGEEGLERLENIRELVSLATKYDEYEPIVGAEHLLEDAALQSDQDEMKDEQEAVRLMTVHASKGLEFQHVFIGGMEEGLFPHERLDTEGVDEEEERRLFYVALTRAKKKVHLSFSGVRTIFGSKRVNMPSTFLREIDDEHLESANPTESGYERTIELD